MLLVRSERGWWEARVCDVASFCLWQTEMRRTNLLAVLFRKGKWVLFSIHLVINEHKTQNETSISDKLKLSKAVLHGKEFVFIFIMMQTNCCKEFHLPCPIMVPGDIELVHPQLRDIHDYRGLSEENLRLNAFMIHDISCQYNYLPERSNTRTIIEKT